MTRIIIVIVITILCSYMGQAQENQSRFKAGFTLGINKTNIIFTSSGSSAARWEPRNTLSFGAVGNARLGENWAVQTGLIFTERGTTFRPLLDVDTRIWTAEIPINFRYEAPLSSWLGLASDDAIRTYGFGGLYLGYGLLAGVSEDKKWTKAAFGELYERSDIGLAIGAGVAVNIKEFSGDIQIKHSIGLKDIGSDPDLSSHIVNTNVSLVYYLYR